MLTTDLDTALIRPRISGRFASLMELYENNYLLVRLFVPALREMSHACYVSCVPGCMDLELSQIEHNRYTTTFNLTYRFTSTDRKACEPDLTIRIYHDARTCEVVTGIIGARRTEHRRVRSLDESWRMNRFLYKWLRYCMYQGHQFTDLTPHPRSELGRETTILV